MSVARTARNALLVYPRIPLSFWGGHYIFDIAGIKASMPPLGLLTVAAMFPAHYRLKVVDMNVEPLTDEHLAWADTVFTSSMIVQERSLRDVIARCNRAGVPVVAGGPHPTSFHDQLPGVDHFVLGEAEEVFATVLDELERGGARRLYEAPRPDVSKTPVPRFDLIDPADYLWMAVQFSRGCPFDCEFCDITKLFGRVPRTKSDAQMLAEFDALYDLGWRGAIFVVDDNFIGNKHQALRLLSAVTAWQTERGHPFSLRTEASINLVESQPLMDAMIGAGFTSVFVGLESPNPTALRIMKKGQNVRKGVDDYLLRSVRKLHANGFEVSGGFILGLDGDGPGVFDAQVDFIQEAGIPMAMLGLLVALRGTNLYHRLQKEGRLLWESSGNNSSLDLNFVPELDQRTLIEGYTRVLSALYDPALENYFARCTTLFENLARPERPTAGRRRLGAREIGQFLRVSRRLFMSPSGLAYARFLGRTARRFPADLERAVRFAGIGHHFRKLAGQIVAVDEFRRSLKAEYDALERARPGTGPSGWRRRAGVGRALRRLRRQYGRFHPDIQALAEREWEWFQDLFRYCARHPEEVGGFRARKAAFEAVWGGPDAAIEALAREYRLGPLPDPRPVGAATQSISIAATADSFAFSRSLERFFREIDVDVIPAGAAAAGPDSGRRLRDHLGGPGDRADYLIVPLSREAATADGARLVLGEPESPEPPAPKILLFAYTQSGRGFHDHVRQLGSVFTPDALKVESAYGKTLAAMVNVVR